MSRSELKYRKPKVTKEIRFEPHEENEIIIVPSDRHKLNQSQLKAAKERWRKNNACMICGSKFKSERDKCIDHCHVTGVIRGQICFSCNTALGHFKDEIYILQSALRYLEYFKYRTDMVDQDLWND